MAAEQEQGARIAEIVTTAAKHEAEVTVRLSHELVTLLSEQLYQSPLKAIEELVVNSFDADASECRVFVPDVGDRKSWPLAVFDNGSGMGAGALADLWHIASSRKRDPEFNQHRQRKQIGKFGIGKLATYAVANKVTYISAEDGIIRAVTLDYRLFQADPTGTGAAVVLPLKILDPAELSSSQPLMNICSGLGLVADWAASSTSNWTLVVLEDLKPKAETLHSGRLRQVLRTAMPLRSDFALFLNGERIESSKEQLVSVVSFSVAELPDERRKALSTRSGEEWTRRDDGLACASLPSGVSGDVLVTMETLGGKSDDLARSNGFFVRVLGRLINEDDYLFGLDPKSHKTMNRFRADIQADDLDAVLTAPREGVLESKARTLVQYLLQELLNEARARYERWERDRDKADKNKTEENRNFVNARLVEQPLADVIVSGSFAAGGEADETWFYLDIPSDLDKSVWLQKLYGEQRERYTYKYVNAGRNERLVKFHPLLATFELNADHDMVAAYSEEGVAAWLLEDLATAEALLEVYLREHGVSAATVGDILEQRDRLLRSLVQDHPFSLTLVAQHLRDSAADERDLEIALVAAARSVGFVAKHISGSGRPDGIARFTDYGVGETRITLEAKSSGEVPSLGAIDFAGLREHVEKEEAQGCLLVAPAYPGKDNDSAAANRARQQRISCWTVGQLADVVDAAERRQLSARNVLEIVMSAFSPDEVSAAVMRLLAGPSWERRTLYRAIVQALTSVHDILPDSPRSAEMIAVEVARTGEFPKIGRGDIESAIRDLAGASQGLLQLRPDGTLVLSGDISELQRRLNGLLKDSPTPRRSGNFRTGDEEKAD